MRGRHFLPYIGAARGTELGLLCGLCSKPHARSFSMATRIILHKSIIHHPQPAPAAMEAFPPLLPQISASTRRTSARCLARRRREEEEEEAPPAGMPMLGMRPPPASAKDVRVALGIDKDDRPRSAASGKPLKSAFMEKLEGISDTLTGYTEADAYQLRALQVVMVFFPVWLLYVLVAAEAIQLPFPLPFL